MTQATPTPTSPPLLHGRYQVEAKLGIGRLAVVYRARDERLQRAVLVHMLRKELMEQAPLRQRFVEESHASARRSHQSLLEVFDSGEVAGRPYMVTEYVAGRTIKELGALTIEDALLYFRQVVGAVAVCQAASVPYPPITSSNLILVADGHVELVESWLTPPAEVAAEIAAYRPPERNNGQPVTAAAAVYSLGLLLFEMLTGRRAVVGDDPRSLAAAHLTARIPSLSEARPALFVPSLDRLIQRATSRDPAQRPRDVAALGQELDDVRRAITVDTQRLTLPPAQRRSLRERINQTASDTVQRPRRQTLPRRRVEPRIEDDLDEEDVRPQRASQAVYGRRPFGGIVIILALFIAVALGAFYLASLATDRINTQVGNFQLPSIQLPSLGLPDIGLPSIDLPDFGLQLPEWLTGTVSGGGEVLVVTIASADGLNLRAEPGLSTQVTGLLPNGLQVRQIDGPRQIDNVSWVKVRARVNDQEIEGWVSASYVKPLAASATQ